MATSIQWVPAALFAFAILIAASGARSLRHAQPFGSGVLFAVVSVAAGSLRGALGFSSTGAADLATLVAYAIPLVASLIAVVGAARGAWPWRLVSGFALGLPLGIVGAAIVFFTTAKSVRLFD